MDLELNVFLRLSVSEVVCPQCAELIDPVAAEGLIANCACGYRVAVAPDDLAAALDDPHYRDNSVPLAVKAADPTPDTSPPGERS